ncbi:MAG TPA: right-handed parallel beta-helix repeat-containing protein [Pyrinomonadaceae bacterium]|nr:right-handed parallel beta-helix repeat-containing protein [Pyrinomonadaceae bacterium]
MKRTDRTLTGRLIRTTFFLLLAGALLACTALWGGTKVEANHPVLVEGNCDSPVPGTTLVAPGTCGDFDGDGRIGTAEDTDGADRIFGTIQAALGPGTGAAAGTGANFNGLILIVKSGRFAERLFIGNSPGGPEPLGTANPGNVTLEAAPGVAANIDAVIQGDPSGQNAARQNDFGITVGYTTNGANRVVTLRNLTIRNYKFGIWANQSSRVHIDNCRLENNLDYGIRIDDNARVVITNTQVVSTGFRIGGPTATPSCPTCGSGIIVQTNAQARIMDSAVSHSFNAGILNLTGSPSNVVLYKVGTFFNSAIDTINTTVAPNANFSQ